MNWATLSSEHATVAGRRWWTELWTINVRGSWYDPARRRTKGRWFYRGEGGRTRTVAQVHIYSHTIHKYSHTIRTLFATIRTLFAHYSRTIRAGSHRFTSVHAGSRRFTQVQAWFAQYQTMFALSALFAGIHTIRKVFALFAQYSQVFARYSHGIRAVFAHIRTCSHLGRR